MTEAEWLACTDPQPMLEYLRGKASDRKWRLYLCGGCRQIAHLYFRTESLAAVEVAERFADGQVDSFELARAVSAAEVPYELDQDDDDPVRRRLVAAASLAEYCAGLFPEGLEWDSWGLEYMSQVDWPGRWLPDCVFGNPFRPVTLNPTMLTWNAGTVPKLAQAIYDERRFGDLPILADALEEAGCDNADILAHCRTEGPHVRGCWVVDLLLGKS
jgi:hypothetical protein